MLACVDVDRLKEVNDRDGHDAGDLVLQRVAGAIRARVRSYDSVIRQGGDEFLCALGRMDADDAEGRFRSIERSLAKKPSVGISVGFAVLADGDTGDVLTARADAAMRAMKALHRAKRDDPSGATAAD